MRKMFAMSALATVVAVAGCRNDTSGSSEMTADLERDLALATAPRVNRSAVVSAIEGGPTGAPSGNRRGLRAPVTVRKRTPQPSPSPVEQEVVGAATAADIPAPVLTATVTETAPAPAPIPEPVAATPSHDPIDDARPGSVPSAGNGDEGSGATGRGSGRRGGGIGGIIGVVIRGGHAGVDKCDPRTDGRGRDGGIFAGRGGIGGMGGGVIVPIRGGGDNRAPVGRPTYPRY